MGVIHLCAVLNERLFVFEGLARTDGLLVGLGHAIHTSWQDDAVPMDRGRLGQFVGNVNAHTVALDCLDFRPVHPANEPPTTSPSDREQTRM